MKLAVMAVALAACGSHETSPAGALGGTHDLRKHLPAALASKVPDDAHAAAHDQTFDVKGAQVKLTWRTFDDGPNKYLLSYTWFVVTPAASITIEAIGDLDPLNVGATDAVVESATVRLRWHDNSSSGTHMGEVEFAIDAAGHAKPE